MKSILLISLMVVSQWISAEAVENPEYSMTCVKDSQMASAYTFVQNGSVRVMMTISTLKNGKILNSTSDFTEIRIGELKGGGTELVSADGGRLGNSAFRGTISEAGATLMIQAMGKKFELNSLSKHCHFNGEALREDL